MSTVLTGQRGIRCECDRPMDSRFDTDLRCCIGQGDRVGAADEQVDIDALVVVGQCVAADLHQRTRQVGRATDPAVVARSIRVARADSGNTSSSRPGRCRVARRCTEHVPARRRTPSVVPAATSVERNRPARKQRRIRSSRSAATRSLRRWPRAPAAARCCR